MIAYRPVMIRPSLRPRLAQGASRIAIIVTDMRGRPVSGALVAIGPITGTTDSSGRVELAPEPGPFDVMVMVSGYGYAVHVDPGHRGDVFVNLPVCLAQPVLTVPEIGSLAAAALITAAGYYWKFEPAKVTGEVLLGATVFTAIYRLSCL